MFSVGVERWDQEFLLYSSYNSRWVLKDGRSFWRVKMVGLVPGGGGQTHIKGSHVDKGI